MNMQLLNQAVRHVSFGNGVVTDVDDRFVTVRFASGERRFQYPAAFSGFLKLKDAEKQREVNAKHERNVRAKAAEREIQLREQAWRRKICAMKIAPDSQAAFNVCPGDVRERIGAGFISTGSYLSGRSRGKPRIPGKLQPNSVCLLTGLPEGGAEAERRVLGAFMVRSDFRGERCADGIVEGHPAHRLCLPEGLSLPYWRYFAPDEIPARWGNVPFKYILNRVAQKILLDLVDLTADTDQAARMRGFYRYFCELNRLPTAEREIG